jgi:hypothetical protein
MFKPTNWVILKTVDKKGEILQVLGSRDVDSTNADSCRLSSAISEVVENDGVFTFLMDSCDDYVCDKQFEGVSAVMNPLLRLKNGEFHSVVAFSSLNLI